MDSDDGPGVWSTLWLVLTLMSGVLLVTGTASGWVLPPTLLAMAFVLCVFIYIGVSARGRSSKRRR